MTPPSGLRLLNDIIVTETKTRANSKNEKKLSDSFTSHNMTHDEQKLLNKVAELEKSIEKAKNEVARLKVLRDKATPGKARDALQTALVQAYLNLDFVEEHTINFSKRHGPLLCKLSRSGLAATAMPLPSLVQRVCSA